nr:hypothetical protein [Tanacetum cinerariifolium]
MFLIASRFPTPPLACAFFSLRATVSSSSKLSRDQTSNSTSSTNPTPKGRIRRSSKQKVENSNFVENPLPPFPMAENQTMAQLLQAPTDGYEEAIVIPEIAATNFELKHGLINLVQNKQFFGHEKEDPHAHLRYFNKITFTMRISAKIDESFSEAWDRFNDLLRACPHHGFSELHQLDTFYNALNVNDQDSLNSAAGRNFLDKMPVDCLKIIESKSKDMVRALLLDKKNQYSAQTSSPTPAPIKAVEPNCVTCGGTHAYQNCPATSRNIYQDNIQEYVSQAAAANYGQGNTGFRPQMVANQIRPPGLMPVQNTQNNFNRGNNFNQNRGSGTLPGNTVTNPKEDLKGITTRSGVAYQGPTIPTLFKVAKQGTEVTKDQVQTSNSQSTAPVQPTVTQSESKTPVSEPVAAPVRMDEFLALADLGASINLMPLSVWKGLSLPELTPTCMTLKLADRTESKPVGIAKDVKVKVGIFHFPGDFVVVDFEPDPRGELTLRIEKEAITYNRDQTSRYSANYDQMTANKIDVTDEACEEYSQEFLGFFNVTASGSPTPSDDPIGINPELCTHKILMEEDYKPAVQNQRRVNPKIHDVIKKEVEKLLDAGLSYPISDSPWVNPVHCVPKKDDFTVVANEENELIPTRLVTGWCMLAIFYDMVEKTMDVFMDDFSVFGDSFENCLSRLDKMLQRYEDTKLYLNWEKSHFMVKEGIVLGHKISKNRIEVDKAKIDVIAKLPHPTTVKGVRGFLGHAGFYRRFIKDFSKISRPMTHLLEKDTPFVFSEDCIQAFQTLKKKLTKAPILIAPN